MRAKEINFCPFRVTTVTYPPILKGTGDVTKAYLRREHGTEKDNDGNSHRKGRARVG